MNAQFSFRKAGYENSADWSRLWDLKPKGLNAKQERAFSKAGEKKGDLLALLGKFRITPEPFDAKAAAARNMGA